MNNIEYWDMFMGTCFESPIEIEETIAETLVNYGSDNYSQRYLFVGPCASGKTTLFRILRKIFYDDPNSKVQFLDDIPSDGRTILENNKIYFCATNQEPKDTSIWTNIFYTTGARLSLPMYKEMIKAMELNPSCIVSKCLQMYIQEIEVNCDGFPDDL